tara:strand:+ start:520 stop:696 length:177 start_codon:yes stop_codon:yes gene_type:complete
MIGRITAGLRRYCLVIEGPKVICDVAQKQRHFKHPGDFISHRFRRDVTRFGDRDEHSG